LTELKPPEIYVKDSQQLPFDVIFMMNGAKFIAFVTYCCGY